ncbi:MAG: ATPase [Phycisphaerae bacterium]|nr:ATPase [Phycisphaerae bacterium]MCZ2400615.1 ATPase [Phycisphaerae bacterium]NUQ49262.1 ATPase [Phycisphaerae bacterium]
MLSRILRRPEALLALTFAGLILAGTIALSLPVSQKGARVSVLDAFFTATSAVCVTGLVTVDTATAWTAFGQTVIAVLIQLGGLGVMTFATLVAQVLGQRVSFSSQAAVHSAFFDQEVRSSIRTAIVRIVLLTLAFEMIGATLIYVALSQTPGLRASVFDAGFLAISAFCNAGFAVYSDNLLTAGRSGLLTTTIMVLIVAGGLGYTVLLELLERGWRRACGRRVSPVIWSLNSRTVLLMSGALIAGGTLLMAVSGMTHAEHGPLETLWHALFQSVTARTAGFNTVDIAALPVPTLMLLMLLMFIGGSPGSCAGGVKTTSTAVWLARVAGHLRGQESVNLLGRRVPDDVVRRAGVVIGLAGAWILGGTMLLVISEGVGDELRLEDILFEQVSALATVGLSTGVTPELSPVGKLWIILSMFAGRVGPLTVALAILPTRSVPAFRYAQERVMIG